MTVMAPSDEEELRKMTATALNIDGPSAVRYPRDKALGIPVSSPVEPLEVGKGKLAREGRDAIIVAAGVMVNDALAAAESLAGEGLEIAVINARFVKPLDKELILEWAQRTSRVLVVEENAMAGGFGAAVAEMMAEAKVTGVSVRLLGIPDEFIPHGSLSSLRSRLSLDREGIRKGILELLGVSSIRPRAVKEKS